MSDEEIQVLQLENKALRFQVQRQAELISRQDEDLRYFRRFTSLVSRAATKLSDLPALKKEILSRKEL